MTHAELGYKDIKIMDANKEKPTKAADVSFNAKKATEFVGDIKLELTRITWPNWEELKVYTQIVVAATFLFGIGLYFIDVLIQSVLNSLSFLIRLIG